MENANKYYNNRCNNYSAIGTGNMGILEDGKHGATLEEKTHFHWRKR